MKAKRWNYSTNDYDEYDVPDESDVDVDQATVCANCGKMIPLRVAYKSKEIKRLNGTSLPVCTDCFDVECTKRQIYYGYS